jgi:hypothetical protein
VAPAAAAPPYAYPPPYAQPIQQASLLGDAPRAPASGEWDLGRVIGLAFLSFFIPVAGWALFGCMHETQERAAMACGAFATLGFLISLLCSVALTTTG